MKYKIMGFFSSASPFLAMVAITAVFAFIFQACAASHDSHDDKIHDEAYQIGYEDGHDDGYDEGYDAGYEYGYDSAMQDMDA